MFTKTDEQSIENTIVNYLVQTNGYEEGNNVDYNMEFAVDEERLFRFLQTSQPKQWDNLGLEKSENQKNRFLSRLQGEITNRGIVDVLRNGVNHYPASLQLFMATPTEGNIEAREKYEQNIFSVTPQLRYSRTGLAPDLVIFINGLPLFTVEIKNTITGQTVEDGVRQYQDDRDPRETLFRFKGCLAHFALDDREIKFCTKLEGEKSWFMPFNKGTERGGAGNPVNPNGLKTAYFWETVLQKEELTNIIENYAQLVKERDKKTGKIKEKLIFPRYHQWDVVKKLLSDAKEKGPGQKYLIQHSAGSGKSNSIAWTAHQFISLQRHGKPIFDSMVIVTDRVNLDKQIRDTIKQFAQVQNTVGHADSSRELKELIKQGKKIIITTVHKFPFILDEIGTTHKGRTFAILIDEAHSSQSGRMSAQMNMALSGQYEVTEDTTDEDLINMMVESRTMLDNASYFAFTATPKAKTLEMFGVSYEEDGTTKHKPFHTYSMRQAIEEGFILDVLKNYTTIQSYYRLAKMVEDDPRFDTRRAQKKLRRYVETDERAIQAKADIMVEHFYEHVVATGKISGKARAMVVTGSIMQALQYYDAIENALKERKSNYRAIVAFSGEKEYKGKKVNEAAMNGFPSSQIENKIGEEPYRFLVVANKFQTGYDQPLLHTMYVDKALNGVMAVQTLSRLNRARPDKDDTFVLDFYNDSDIIRESFADYYTTTILSDVTDPNKLYDMIGKLESYQVYAPFHVENVVHLFLNGAQRDELDPILDSCAAVYKELDEDGQVEFKSNAKAFVRTYEFLASILPHGMVEWERLSIFLTLLTPKLPTPIDEDLADGILETIDLDSYRAEKNKTMNLVISEDEVEALDPARAGAAGGRPEAEMDFLSNIIETFNDRYYSELEDPELAIKLTKDLPEMVANDEKYQNAIKYSDKQNARIEGERALDRAMMSIMGTSMELFKLWTDNNSYNKELADTIFSSTYRPERLQFLDHDKPEENHP